MKKIKVLAVVAMAMSSCLSRRWLDVMLLATYILLYSPVCSMRACSPVETMGWSSTMRMFFFMSVSLLSAIGF